MLTTRALAVLCLGTLGSISIATACGSSDKSLSGRGGGGEAGEAVAGAGGAATNSGGGSSNGPTPGGAAGAAGEENPSSGGQPVVEGGAGAGGSPADAGASGSAVAGGAGGVDAVGGAGGASVETVIDLGFDGSDTLPANLDPGTATLTPSQGYADLGPIDNKFGSTFLRGPTGTVITLTLSDLPPHDSLSISMLFAAIDSLDGTGSFPAGDFFKITLDGVIVFRESFANAIESQIQSYDPPAAVILARHVDLGFSGPGGYYTDSAYDFGQDPTLQNLPHTASTATLVFTLEGEGVQDINDESWALDNLRVTVH